MAHSERYEKIRIRVVSDHLTVSGMEYSFALPRGEYDADAFYALVILASGVRNENLMKILLSFNRSEVLLWGGRVAPNFAADTTDLMANYNRKQIEIVG